MSTEDSNKSKATIKLLVETDAEDYDIADNVIVNDDATMIKHESQGMATDKVRSINIKERLKAANMLVPGSKLGLEFQDQYRKIKRPLLSNAFGKTASLVERGNLILVTSSIPGEGKTFSSINLALSIAQEKDKTVLLVDCDVAMQGVSRMLGIDRTEGLVDVLQGSRMSVGDVLLQSDISNLRLLSAGKQDEYVTELLTSDRMSELVNEIVSRYGDRVIILDAPPLLATPQTQILAGLVGQVVFVIETGKTSQSLVQDAIELIPEEKAVGLIMNKNEGLTGMAGYNYGYYGHYGVKEAE